MRIDELHKGDEFTAIDGQRYRYVRKDGALSGCHHVERITDGKPDVFAGSANVTKREANHVVQS